MIAQTGKLLDYKDYRPYSNTFIETGSGHGAGIQRALDAGFEKVISIEAFDPSFEICALRFCNDRRVHLFRGTSIDMLPRVLVRYPERNVIFLDAHPSGERSFGHAELMGGDAHYSQDYIIKEELRIILERSHCEHVIIIDDISGDEPTSTVYAEMIAARFPDYSFEFYDENLSGDNLYKNKLLVAIPGKL